MELLDSVSIPSGTANEDRIGHRMESGWARAWVLDGATGVGKRSYAPEGTDAAWIAAKIGEAFEQLPDLRPIELARAAIERARDIYRTWAPHDLPPYALPSAAAVWAVQRGREIEFAWLGDCSILAETENGFEALNLGTERPWEGPVEQRVRALIEAGQGAGNLVALLMDELRADRSQLNQPGGYWMMGIEPRAADAVECCRRGIRTGDRALLMSDGFSRLIDHFALYDAPGLLAAAASRGLAALAEELRAAEHGDPDRRRAPRVKLTDDTSALLLGF